MVQDAEGGTSKLDEAIKKASKKKKVDEKKEAAEILKTTADNIKTLDNEDASLSDIKSLMN